MFKRKKKKSNNIKPLSFLTCTQILAKCQKSKVQFSRHLSVPAPRSLISSSNTGGCTCTIPSYISSTFYHHKLVLALVLYHHIHPGTGRCNYCTMLDQGPSCFGHLAKSPFLVNVMVLAKLNFQDDLDKYIN